MSDQTKFKIRITPKRVTEFELKTQQCLYMLSIGARGRSYEDLVSAFNWATSHFPKCALLLGDGLFRITLEIREGLSEEAARERARLAGNEALCSFERLLGRSVPEIIRSSELMIMAAFSKALQVVEHMYRENVTFSHSVEADALGYINRQIRHDQVGVPRVDALALAMKYLLEEIAMYLLLAESGWRVDVYLGKELPTLAKIINREIAGAPEALEKRINVSVEPN